jgi:hypothetical protein
MHRVQGSNHRRKGFACSLKNLVRDRVDGEGFMGNLYVAHQRRDFGIGKFRELTGAVHSPQCLNAPQSIAIGFVPLAPNPEGVWLM